MTYKVILSGPARKVFARVDKITARRLAKAFTNLEMNPTQGHDIRALAGSFEGFHRIRVGDWRIIYRVDDKREEVFITAIGPRGDVYK